jgi:hypothetical protein
MQITAKVTTRDNSTHCRIAAVNVLLEMSTRADRGERKGRVVYMDGDVVGDFTVTDETRGNGSD